MTKEVVVIIIITIIIFLRTVWFVTDPRPLDARFQWIKKPIHFLTLTITVGTALLAAVLYSKDYYLFTNFELGLTYIGLLTLVTGAVFSSWARIYMGKFWAPANEGHDIESQSKLLTGGPFRYSRNPIYAGLLLTAVGFFLSLNSYLIITVCLIYWYFNKSIKTEEVLMKQAFGKKYLLYKKKTPKFFWS